ncbi:hypothetical protein BH11GEM2_BH11GEM2_18290 [soil metagenome]
MKTLGLDCNVAQRIPLDRLNEHVPGLRRRGELPPARRSSVIQLKRIRGVLVARFRFLGNDQDDEPSIGRRKHGSPTRQRILTYVAVEYGNQNASWWLSGFHCCSFASGTGKTGQVVAPNNRMIGAATPQRRRRDAHISWGIPPKEALQRVRHFLTYTAAADVHLPFAAARRRVAGRRTWSAQRAIALSWGSSMKVRRITCRHWTHTADISPTAGSPEESCRFGELQAGLADMFQRVFPDPRAARTIVAVPSMSLDRAELTKLVGAVHYEERLLCLLLLLRLPAARIVFVSSVTIPTNIVDYYLRLLPDVSLDEARNRLIMLSCDDDSAVPLSEKILDRPELVERIRACVTDPRSTHITCFNATALERSLAVRLGVPVYGCDPALSQIGTKSGSREVFHEAGVRTPDGYEHLRGVDDMVRALAALKRAHPHVQRAVVKLEEGFSGEGNAIFSYSGAPEHGPLETWVRAELPSRIRCVAPHETWDSFREKFARMGGVVEAFVEGGSKRSPSVQCRVDPLGGTPIISTHDQVLGGETGQVYLGCMFPALASCCPGLHAAAQRVTDVLARKGIVGRFAIDFVSTRTRAGWIHHAIEINVRKGGTTHPFLSLNLLTNGAYDVATGLYHSDTGRVCYYVASDNLSQAAYRILTPSAVTAAAVREGLHFDGATEQGVIFYMMGALAEHGKVGAVCIARTRAGARHLLEQTVALLDRESGSRQLASP